MPIMCLNLATENVMLMNSGAKILRFKTFMVKIHGRTKKLDSSMKKVPFLIILDEILEGFPYMII